MQNEDEILLKKELDRARKELNQLRDKDNNTGFLLHERQKELACHNAITRIFGTLSLSQEEVINEILKVIPPAWLYPQYAQALVSIRNRIYQTKNYQKTSYLLTCDILALGEKVGYIEVSYPEEIARGLNPVFMDEEKDLLLSVAGRLGNYIEFNDNRLALSASEKKYRNIFENVQEAYLETTPEGTIIEISPSIEYVSGGDYRRTELLGKPVTMLYAIPEERDVLLKELLKNGKADNFRLTYKSKSGQNRQISLSSHLILDEAQKPEKILSIIRDITEQKATEGAYRQSLEKLRIIADNPYHWEFWEGPDGKAIYHSPSCKNFTGIDSKIIEEDCGVILNLIHPDDRQAYLQHHEESRRHFKSRNLEFRMISMEGKLTYIEHYCKPVFDENNRFLGIRGTNIDVTDRKIVEQELLEQEINAKTRHQALVDLTLDNAIVAGLMPDALNRITEIITKAAHVAGVSVWKFNANYDEMVCLSHFDKSTGKHKSGSILKRTDYPVYFDTLIEKGITTIVDTLSDPLARELRESFFIPNGISSSIDVGIVQEGKLTGVLCLQHKGAARKWHPEEEAFANTVAGIISQLFVNIELRRVETELRETNRKMNVLVDNLKGFAYRCSNDREWTMDFISKGISELSGYEQSEFENNRIRTYNSLIHPDDQQMVWDEIQNCLAKKIPYTLEYRIITSSEDIKWVWEKGQGVFEGNSLLALEGFITDITERKESENVLRRSELKFRALFESASVGMVLLENDGRIQMVNRKLTEITGYTTDDLTTVEDWWIAAYPDENYRMTLIENWNNEIEAYLAESKDFKPFEAKVRCKNGEDRYVEISFVAVGDVNIATFVDVTERTLNTNQLEYQKNYIESMLAAIPDLMFIFDSQGVFLEVNPGKDAFLSVPKESFLNKNLHEVFPTEFAHQVKTRIQQVLHGKIVEPFQYEMPVNEIPLDFEARFSPFGNDKVIVLVSDITWRKKAEKALTESEEKYRLIAENTSDGILILNSERTMSYASPGYLKQMGYNINETLHLDFDKIYELVHPDDRDHLFELILAEISKQTGNLSYTYRAKHQDGHYIWLEDRTHLTYDAAGKMMSAHIVSRDVTARIEFEKQLKQSEEKYRSLIDSSDAAIMLMDEDGRFLFLNNIAALPWGKTPEEMIGMNISDLFPPAQVVQMTDNFKSVLHSNTGKSFEAESMVGNSMRWLRISLQPVRDNLGKPYAVLMIATDMTDRRRAEELVSKSEKKYRTLFDDSPDSLMILKDGVSVECNRACEIIFNTTREHLIGKTPVDFAPEYQPNGKKSAEYAGTVIAEVIQSGSVNFEWLHKRLDQTEFLAEVNLTIIDFEGQPAILARVRDISAKREAEEKLRKLSRAVEQSPVSIVITNKEGLIEYANPTTCETTGYSLDELIGKNPRVLQSGETSREVYDHLWDNISTGKDWKGIFLNRKKNGQTYWESATIAPILDASGEITHYVALKEDITERRKMQLELQQSQERFVQITEQTQTVIWEVDINGLYIYVNAVAEIVWGYKPEELVGKKHFYDLHPAEMRDEYIALTNELINSKIDIKNFENPIERKDGKIRWVSSSAAPVINQKGEITGYRGIDTDVTDRRNAEEEIRKFRTITDEANYGAALASLDGILLYTNDAFARMHGYEVSEIQNRPLAMLHSEHQMKRVIETIELLKKNGGFTAEEVWRTRKDGTFFPSLMNAKIIMDSNNQPQYMSATAIDITEIKEKEQALLRSEESLNKAQVIANMGSWEFEVNEQKVTWSKNYYQLIGIDPSQPPLPLNEIKKMIHPADRNLFEAKISEMLEPEKHESFNFRLITPQGNKKWIQANMVPIFQNGQLTHITGVSIDITEKKEAEEKIRQQNIRLNAIMDAMPDMIFVSDRQGNYLEYFKSKANVGLGDYEDLVGKNIRDAFDPKTAEIHLKNINECLITKKIITYEYPRVEDGQLKYFEGRIVYMEEDKVLRFVRDVTERKHAESEIKKLNLAIEQSPVSIVITDLDANIQYVSPAFFETTGYRYDEAVGQNARILKSGKTPVEVYENLWKTIKSNKVWHTEWINKKKNGDFYWESITISPIQNENGEIINYLAIKQDISERKKAEQEILDLNMNLERRIVERTKDLQESNIALEKARIEADKANKAKSEFLSRMSHELRTPMNSILGFAQLLEMGNLNPKQMRGVSHIIKSGKHLLDLINEVLDISRIESGRLSLSLEPVNLRPLINEMIDLVQPQASMRNISVKSIKTQADEFSVKTDLQRLKQILLNLLNNAIKYNVEGGSVTVNTSRADTQANDAGIIRISIIDTGKGISAEGLAKLFTPFERIGAEKTLTEGTGLGLTVAKKLTEAMGGRIGVESTPGEGSTFWIELPACESQLEQAIKSGSVADDTAMRINLKATILYVEDNESNVELIEQILIDQRPGVTLVTTIYGEQAVKLAIENKPDMILLDLNLPDIQGDEVLFRLMSNEKTREIPVIVLSADAMPRQISKLLKAGASQYLTKPIDVVAFLEIIDELLVK